MNSITKTKVLFTALLLGALLPLTGCATAETGSTSTDSGQVTRQAGVRGSRVCITNETGKVAKIIWYRADSYEKLTNNILGAGKTTCGQGFSLGPRDAWFDVVWPDRQSQLYQFTNQAVGFPLVYVDSDKEAWDCGIGMDDPHGRDISISAPCGSDFRVGDTYRYMAYDWHDTRVTRVGDSADWIEFRVYLIK